MQFFVCFLACFAVAKTTLGVGSDSGSQTNEKMTRMEDATRERERERRKTEENNCQQKKDRKMKTSEIQRQNKMLRFGGAQWSSRQTEGKEGSMTNVAAYPKRPAEQQQTDRQLGPSCVSAD